MPFVALLASAIVGFLAQAAVSLVGRVLIALGIGFVTYNGLDLLMSGIKSLFLSNVSQVGSVFPQIVGVIGLLKIPMSMNMILTTLAIRATLAGVTGGSVRKMIQK
ncbi:DUF2523 domain-containing protein [Ralstonia pseudosolanacearum]|uniref:Putative minor coat protein n=1 Tax=Ralstonia phage PE226 TaxID=926543 RepID=E5F073_9VIRU|nr:DUF2523 domain-containing protein [Ralstonia pseudosolanacearum]YP_004327585.1 putative minor coat protein [Ralstonia phage PE226]AOE93138.1 hypothetical protein LBM341_04894 [Ralstonia solanacearum]ARS56113.1 Clp protease ClpB [Ralstonia solanacearum FJAT-91]ESS50647.1 hypothetical protein L665_00725 [Ralstonia solanacearum SD54]ADQ27591.1 putative minor coat protein [Ralstonia phage PE226]AXW59710.1 DUF2523 domain-containing protein [Ralstonia solanacearum]